MKELIATNKDVDGDDVDVCICCLNKGPVRSMCERTNSGELYTECMLLCFGLDVMVTNIGDCKRAICHTCERQLRDSLHFRRQVEHSLCVLEEEAKATDLKEEVDELATTVIEKESTIPEDTAGHILICPSLEEEVDELTITVDEKESTIPEDAGGQFFIFPCLEEEVDELTTTVIEKESTIPEYTAGHILIFPSLEEEVDELTITVNEKESTIPEDTAGQILIFPCLEKEVDELTITVNEKESTIPEDTAGQILILPSLEEEVDELTITVNEKESTIPEDTAGQILIFPSLEEELDELTITVNEKESTIPEDTAGKILIFPSLEEEVDELTITVNEKESKIPEDITGKLIVNSNQNDVEEYYMVTYDSDVNIEEYLLPNDYNWRCQNILTLLDYSKIYPFHYNSGKFKCFFCGRDFYEASQIRSHTKKHSIAQLKEMVIEFLLSKVQDCYIKVDVSNLECRLCSRNLPNIQSLKIHLKDVHSKYIDPTFNDNIVPFKLSGVTNDCQLCEKKFEKMVFLIIHMNEHFQNYICEICGAAYITLCALTHHKKTHKTGSFQCDHCDRTFITTKKLYAHLSNVYGKRWGRKCPKCPKRLKNNYALMKHRESVHNEAPRIYKCHICSKVFNLKTVLKLHIKLVHVNERTYECPECPAKFCVESDLKRHMPKHTRVKDFKCDVCQKEFAHRYTLIRHMETHSRRDNDRPFVCDVCGNAFFNMGNLKRHLKNVHSLR